MQGDCGKKLSIIILSFNDLRILRAIESVRRFDDLGQVAIVVIDGGSKPEVVAAIAELLTADDKLISERDRGIFDALNKGLAACDTTYIGWLGSDDFLSGKVKASEVIHNLESCDLFIANTAHVQETTITRITHSWPSRHRLARLGLNNPHFSTFGRSELLKRERFSLDIRGSDIDYFLRIFDHKPSVRTTAEVSTYMEEGGFSNASYKSILKTNIELFKVYAQFTARPVAAVALLVKLGYKVACKLWFKINRQSLSEKLS